VSTYQYTGRDGDDMLIERSSEQADEVFLRANPGVFVAAADLPTIVAQLYEAAGQSVPIILDRPAEEDLRAGGWLDGKCVRAPERAIGTITPDLARAFAARMAAAADVADAEPDPEQVKQITDLLMEHAGWHRHSAELAAKAILRAGYTRSES